ncbi:E3 ubiquitin-protein ligase TRIM21-like [Strongylocentrotus purpuratus]|uniref:B box-type domain-containing protein n=1 Tax=Strongylocentrotus purpuratus TaxID=7668 RepID=A0A7M7P5A6_STRPU|nr:E3 ubiquitin-protein ligase TRIM21-like [Strongylocentrotus purpuratus]
MASELSSVEGVCEGDECKANTDLTFYVKEKKKLCHDCASKKECFGPRKGGPNLYCEKHGKDIDLYCKTHGVALCVSCAMIDHVEKPCMRQDIDDAIMDNKAKLNILKEKAMEKLQLCRVHGKHISQCRQSADEHLQSIKDEVDSVIEKAIARDKVREQEDAAKIDQEIDGKNQKLKEEIRKNNEERNKRHDENKTNAEKRQEPIDNKHRDLYADIQNIAQEIERKIGELEKSWQDDTKTTENANQTLDTVLVDDQNIVKDGHRVNTSVSDELKKPLNEGEVKEINRVVSCVRFVKGVGR